MKTLIYALPVLLVLLTGSYEANSQHTITTKSGEKLNGELQSINDNTISFFHKGSIVTFHIGQVKSIEFDGIPGSGSSINTTAQKGVSFVMPGRKLVKQPKVDNLTMERGVVVVAISINKYGDIVKADPGAEGTTTTSEYLLTKAKQAAQSSKFDSDTTFPLEQKGTITITF